MFFHENRDGCAERLSSDALVDLSLWKAIWLKWSTFSSSARNILGWKQGSRPICPSQKDRAATRVFTSHFSCSKSYHNLRQYVSRCGDTRVFGPNPSVDSFVRAALHQTVKFQALVRTAFMLSQVVSSSPSQSFAVSTSQPEDDQSG